MKSLVFDSTPLIYLGKLEILDKLKQINTKKIIPLNVYKEVVEEGKKLGFIEALYIEKLVEEKYFEVIEFKIILDKSYLRVLSDADLEVLSGAKETKGIAIVDELAAREIASINQIEAGGTAFILFQLLKNELITKKEFKELLDSIIKLGWRCSTELYFEILGQLNNL